MIEYVYIRGVIMGELPSGKKQVSLMATNADGIRFYTDDKNIIPAADVIEVKRGQWEVCSDEYEICASEFVCSECKESFVSSELTDEQFFKMMKYCPNCGAKMDAEKPSNN